MTEDDFLGAAFVQLSKEEPVVIKKNLQLGFSLIRQGAGSVEPSNLGSVCISLVFRPVPALSAAGLTLNSLVCRYFIAVACACRG